MRSLSPERTTVYGPLVRKGLAEDRDLLRECEPWLRAAYENRDVTVDEFEKAQARTERRLDAVMALA